MSKTWYKKKMEMSDLMKNVKNMKIGKDMKRWFALMLALMTIGTSTAFAGQWEQQADGGWKYAEDNGSYATEWQQIDGTWYYMDSETGLWNSHPAMNETTACRLLENAVNKTGWYAKEEYPIHYVVTAKSTNTYTVTLLMETAPDSWSETLNTFEVNKKSGTAKSISTKIVLDLYE